VLFNTLGWARTDFVDADVGFAETGITNFFLRDRDSNIVPVQLLDAERYRDGGLKRVKFAFVARDVPSLGYCVYHVVPGGASAERKLTAPETPGANLIENDFYQLRFDAATGALTNLFVKDGQWEALSGPANVVAREPDKGDFWELYKNLDGFQNVMVNRPLPVPDSASAQFSNDPTTNAVTGAVQRGPVFSQFSIKHPFGAGTFSTRVRLYSAIPRIDFETKLLNNEKFVRYRVLVPTSIQNGRRFDEIPFGAIERPSSQEFPAQNWMDYSDGNRGVALLNRGLPGNNASDGTLMLSLMRSTRIQSYGIGGGFEGQSSDSGLELGKELTLHYSLVPHTGDWRQARVFRFGLELNNPLLVRKAATHAGRLPQRWRLLEVSHPNVVLSALKPGRADRAILRVYEAAGQPASEASIRLRAKILDAHETNLIEDREAKLRFANDTFRFSLHPFEIKTFELKLRERSN